MTDFRLRSLPKTEFARMLRTGKKALCCLVSFAFFAMQTMPLLANPVNGTVSAGSANISSAGNTLTVTQTTDKAVIDWRGFDIAKGETTRFVQPSSSSMTLNRVSSNAPSFIDGNLTANGNLVVVNPNGVWFGPNARVDVNGLIASTANISNNAFMNNTGILNFDEAGNPDAAIINDGLITAKDAGLVGLVAPNVINRGIIYARLGRVALASGDTATVDLYGDDLIKVAVSDKVKSQLVSNSGVIAAPGGTIALTAAAGKDIVNSLITVHGELAAPSIREHNGKIIIAAQGSNKTTKQGHSTVLVSGILDASGRNASEHGGSIQVTGDNIGLLAGTRIDASGSDGLSGTTLGKAISSMRIGAAGGDIRIGGDYLGGGHTPTALNLYVDKDVLVLNDALNSGDAGRTIFWSDGTTQFYGNVYARALGGKGIHATTWNAIAGGNAGDGGFIETSGHGHLDAGGYVDLTSSNGSRGTYFLDPTNITIYGNFAPNYATVITGSTGALSASLKLWVDSSDTANVNLTYSALTTAGANSCASSCLTANGTSGATTITTSANIASTLQVGQRLRLGAAGSVTAASTLGTDTYTISSISGTTITFSSALTATYTNAVVYAGYVSQMTDKSGLGNNATQATAANMPLWISNGFNSIGTTNYSGSSYLNLPNLMSGATAGSGFFSAINAADPPGTGSQTGMPFGNWGTGIQSHYVWTDGVVYDSFGSNLRKTAANPVPALTTANVYGVISAANDWRDYINGQALFSTTTNTVAWGTTPTIGNNVGSYFFTGKLGDVFAYNKAVSANEQTLLNQYISGKWNVALLPPGSGATEVAQATASVQKGDAVDGYSVFTTRYLQRLSQSANISLQSSNNITLDFQGDNMNFTTAGRTLTLTAGNQITTASTGTITTNAGAITLNATNGILINNAFTINSANGAVNINNAVTLAANLSVTSGSGTLTFASTIDGAGGLTTSSTNGATIFNGAVGGTTPITSYTGTGRDLTINQNITSSGNISAAFTRDITLAATKTITTGAAGALTLTAAGNSVNGTGNLNLNGNLSVGTGALTLLSGVNGTRPSWTATTSNLVRQGATFGTVSIQGFLDTTISRDINSSGNITLLSNRDLTLSPANTLTTSATGALSMTAANGSTAGTGNLTINGNLSVGTGALTFLSGINGTRPSLTVTTTNLVRQGATFGAVSIQGFNAFTLNRILNSTSSVLFANNTTTTLQNNVTSTASTITFSNPVIIAEATSINVSTTNQAITFGSTITDTAGGVTETLTVNPGTSSATFTGAVNGVAITVSAGSATLSSAWGATSALGATSITTTSSLTLPAITAASLSVNTSGASSSLQVSGSLSTTLSGGALSLTSGAFIVSNAASTISSTNGAITFNAGSSLYLATASAAINSTGGAITFTGTNGIIVGADTSVNSGGGNINFNQAVTMAAPLSLTLGTGTLTFASTIDGSAPSYSTFSVLAVGAGGGGGGMDAATRGSGGGSGAAVDAVVNVSAGAVYTVAVGGGGAGGTNSLSSAAGGAGGVNGGGSGGAAGASGTSGGGGGGGGFSGIYIGGTYYVVAGGGAGGGGGNEGFAKSVGGAGGGTQTSNTGTTSGGVGQSYSGDGGGGGGGGGGFLGGAGQTGIAVSTPAAFSNGGSNYSNPGNVSATITLGNAGSANAVSTGGGAATIAAGRATFYSYGNNLGVGGTAVGSGTAGTNGAVIIRYTGTTAQALVVGGTITTSGGDVIVTYANTGTNSSFSPIAGCSGNCNLTINAGTVNFGGNVGSTQALDAVSVTTTNGLTLPNITASSVIARTTGVAADLTIAAAKVITASGSGDAIKLAAGRNFINNAGSGALVTPSGRWLVYSTNPSNDTIGGLSNSFRRFSCTYGGSCPSFPGTGNGLLYTTTPLLTITPNALSSIVYGAAAPNLSGYAYTATGYLGSDSSADTLTGSLTGSSSYIAGSNIGTYNINYGLGSLSSVLGYGFSYANNASAFTVTPRPITITADAKTKTYGAADPSLTYQLTSGSLYGSDSLTGTIARTAGESVAGGPYSINQNTLSAGSNYTITYVSDNLSITPAALTVTAAAKTKTYGAADPALTYTYSGLTNGDTASVFTGALSRAAGETVTGGPYAINQNTLTAGSNYTITYTGNNLSITPATLNITANALSKVYGTNDPTLTYTMSGGTNIAFTGALSRAIGEAVNSYAVSQGTLSAGNNYHLNFVSSTFAITPATLYVAANSITKVYGAVDPALTYSVSGLANGDILGNVLTGALSRESGTMVGSYRITKHTLASNSANYTLDYTSALFNIISNDIPVTVTRVSQDPTLNMPTAVHTTEPNSPTTTTTQSQTSTTSNNPNVSASEVPTDSQGAWLRISPALAAALGEAPVFIKY
ncbi:MAG: MBG domain-containing protein [Alphaproteobacteria bacterium]|nr:MBG domain-containing protein [Alphaproteobacteria bacterium]